MASITRHLSGGYIYRDHLVINAGDAEIGPAWVRLPMTEVEGKTTAEIIELADNTANILDTRREQFEVIDRLAERPLTGDTKVRVYATKNGRRSRDEVLSISAFESKIVPKLESPACPSRFVEDFCGYRGLLETTGKFKATNPLNGAELHVEVV